MDQELKQIFNELTQIIMGRDEAAELLMIGALACGHILIEDVPGVGKTVACKGIASLLGASFTRVQCTPDLMPTDLTGVNIYLKSEERFVFQPGPLFSHIILIDELNRASPRTQSSLLEAMEETQVTVDRISHQLSLPFWVIATQNPSGFVGTYPVPESQLDRFMLSFSIGYASEDDELKIFTQGGGHTVLQQIQNRLNIDRWRVLTGEVDNVMIEDSVSKYMLAHVRATRQDQDFRLGVSTRGALQWRRAVQSRARLYGRDFVTPDDVQATLCASLSHRVLTVRPSSLIERGNRLKRISSSISVPR